MRRRRRRGPRWTACSAAAGLILLLVGSGAGAADLQGDPPASAPASTAPSAGEDEAAEDAPASPEEAPAAPEEAPAAPAEDAPAAPEEAPAAPAAVGIDDDGSGAERDPPAVPQAWDGAGSSRTLGTLEAERVALAMRRLGMVPEEAPEGLRICHIVPVTEEVFVEEGVFPLWFNRLRANTNEGTVRNALRFAEGDRWDPRQLRDSERRLRGPGVLAYVAMVPFAMEEEGCVGVLVVTRDIWSLRPGFSVATSGATLTTLYLGVEELNLLGTHTLFAVDVFRRLGDVRAGPRLRIPQLGASDLRMSADGDVQFERGGGGKVEGGRFGFVLERPLLDGQARRGWALSLGWSDLRERRFLGPDLRLLEVEAEGESAEIPERWQALGFAAEAVRAWGWGTAWRNELEVGPRFTDRRRRTLAEEEEAFSPALLEAFRDERLGRDERGSGPVARWRFFENRFLWMTDMERFAVGEEVRLGPSLAGELRWSDPVMGASSRWVRQGLAAAWTFPLGDDAWVRAQAGVSVRLEEGWEELQREAELRLMGPRVTAGRFVARARVSVVARDRGATLKEAGSDSALRGHPNGALVGRDMTRLNLEWRSRPLRIVEANLGAVLFVDGAVTRSAEGPWEGAAGTGVGLRILIPQLNALVQRIDLGFPVGEDGPRIGNSRVPRPLLSIGLMQAF